MVNGQRMKLRKVGKTCRYDTVHCPDTDVMMGQSTKLIKYCDKCDSFYGMLDDISGRYIRCGYQKPMELIDRKREVELGDTRFYINKRLMWALNRFDIHPDEFGKGLSHVKGLARKRYKSELFKYHPDTTVLRKKHANRELIRLNNMFKRIDNLDISPPTDDNMDIFMEI